MPTTAKVPKSLQPIFVAAEKQVGDYFKQRELHPEQGTIEIFGARYILLRGASISVEFFQLCRKLFGAEQEAQADQFASSFLYELAQSIGRSDARALHEKMRLDNALAKLSAGPIHFAHAGWGFVEILEESQPDQDTDFFIAYKHTQSFECDAWRNTSMTTNHPVCVMSAGYSGGWCQESFGISLEARELSCQALGQPDCHFVMARPERIEQQIQDYKAKHPDLQASASSITPARQDLDDDDLTAAIDHRLLIYARDMETMQQSLVSKETLLNKEVSARKHAEAELFKSEERWKELSDVLFDCILICRGDEIDYANQSSESLFGISILSILDTQASELFGQSNWQKIKEKVADHDNKPMEMELERGTHITHVDLQVHVSADGTQVLALRDVSDRVGAKMRLERLANFDSLTGLPNRVAFERIVARQIGNSSNQDHHALLYLDLDKFKNINDSFGHTAGDLMLYEVAQRTRDGIRAGDVLARIGGDEFTLWLPGLQSSGQARMTAERILGSLKSPFVIGNNTVNITFSIGIAMYPEHGTELTQLMQRADNAMYSAKSSGRNTFRFYQSN